MAAISAMAAMALSSCSQQDVQMAMLVETFTSQLEVKETELANLRNAETQLREQLGEVSGRMRAMESELTALRESSSKLDASAIAETLTQVMKSDFGDVVKGAVRDALSSVQLAPQPNPAAAPAGGTAGGTASPASPAAGGETGRSTDGSRQRFVFEFP